MEEEEEGNHQTGVSYHHTRVALRRDVHHQGGRCRRCQPVRLWDREERRRRRRRGQPRKRWAWVEGGVLLLVLLPQHHGGRRGEVSPGQAVIPTQVTENNRPEAKVVPPMMNLSFLYRTTRQMWILPTAMGAKGLGGCETLTVLPC